MIKKVIILLIVVSTALTGCRLDSFDDLPEWRMEILTPLIKNITPLDHVVQLENRQFATSFAANELGFPNNTYPEIPPFSNLPAIGPHPLQISEVLTGFHAIVFRVKLDIYNQFPFDIQKGARLVFKNPENQELVYEFELLEDIVIGEIQTLEIIIENQWIPSDLDFYIDGLSSPGTPHPTVIDESTLMSFRFLIREVKINEVMVKENVFYNEQDTIPADLGEYLEFDNINGNLNVYLTNRFPMEMKIQLHFLDHEKEQLDSLFAQGPLFLPAADVDPATGIVNEETLIEVFSSIAVSPERMQLLQNSLFLAFDFYINTQQAAEATLVKSSESYLELQLVGDFDVTLKPD